jgi:hypothetical protein
MPPHYVAQQRCAMMLLPIAGPCSVPAMPTERPGHSQLSAQAHVAVELDDPITIPGEHGGDIFTDDVLVIYALRVKYIGDQDEDDTGWQVTARVQGHRVARRLNPDGSPKRLRSYGQQTFTAGEDVFPDWLEKIAHEYHPEHV